MEVSCQLHDQKALLPPLQSTVALGTNLDESHSLSRGLGEDKKNSSPCKESNTNSSITPPYPRYYNLPTAHFRFQDRDEENKYL